MTETDLDIPTADGAMNTRVVSPGGSGPYPVVLFYMDAFGVRDELHEMARRLAAKGYLVLLPNLYYRETRRFVMKGGEEGMNEMRAMMGRLRIDLVNRDTRAMLDFLDTQPTADARRVGAVGYCMSGPFVFAAATEFADRIAAIASIHGANMVTERADSPHRAAERLRCETYVACAEVDKWASTDDMAVLERALQASGAPFRLEWYPGAQHGFVFPSRSGAYEHASAERHWQRLFDLFGRRL
ncbi:MAG TPA: dienelactone hydrolase family protein [Hydrogenophaga sp.]|uniref:dienelactone hydrolase family protein n=1 Tax=Hydrogenophaga sp. TaxID=1904254 RepID=UPI002CCDDBAD|nr:dienelactone hydrolase family protein [Hydrogenophaga sp.]HSX93314.1 dienelactone hydrolase family protein [Hydrogenophaga sp.]